MAYKRNTSNKKNEQNTQKGASGNTGSVYVRHSMNNPEQKQEYHSGGGLIANSTFTPDEGLLPTGNKMDAASQLYYQYANQYAGGRTGTNNYTVPIVAQEKPKNNLMSAQTQLEAMQKAVASQGAADQLMEQYGQNKPLNPGLRVGTGERIGAEPVTVYAGTGNAGRREVEVPWDMSAFAAEKKEIEAPWDESAFAKPEQTEQPISTSPKPGLQPRLDENGMYVFKTQEQIDEEMRTVGHGRGTGALTGGRQTGAQAATEHVANPQVGAGKLIDWKTIGYDKLDTQRDFEDVTNSALAKDSPAHYMEGLRSGKNVWMSDEELGQAHWLEMMTPQEMKRYDYLYVTKGAAAANEYAESLRGSTEEFTGLDQRQAVYDTQALDKLGAVPKAAAMIGTNVKSGMDQFVTGMKGVKNWITQSREIVPVGYSQYVNSIISDTMNSRSGWGLFGKGWKSIIWDTGVSVSNQLPSTALSMMFGGAGTAAQIASLSSMGLQAVGNTYDEAIREGRDPQEAAFYATMSGVVESLTEIIGGVGMLSGGTLTEEMTESMVNGLEHAVTRWAARNGFNFLGEGIEEMVSGMAEPLLEAIAYGDDPMEKFGDPQFWEDVLLQGFEGGLSGLGMGGIQTTAQMAGEMAQNAENTSAIIDNGTMGALADVANTLPADSKARKMLDAMARAEDGSIDTGKTGNQKIGEFYRALSAEVGSQLIGETVLNGITQQLMSDYGMSTKEADTAASAIDKALRGNGEEMTRAEKAALEDLSSTEKGREFLNGVTDQIENSEAAVNVQKVQEALTVPAAAREAGKTVAGDLQNAKTVEQQESIVREGMKAAGVDEQTIEQTAQAVVKVANGEQLTEQEQQAVSGSDAVLAFAEEAVNGTNAETQEETVPVLRGSSDVETAHNYGYAGLSIGDFENMKGEQATQAEQQAFARGQRKYVTAMQKKQSRVDRFAQGTRPAKRKGGVKVISEQDAAAKGVQTFKMDSLSKVQKNAYAVLNRLSKATGINFVLYESERNRNGEHVGANGWYDNRTQTAYIDIASGVNGEEQMLQTAAHEVTHFIKAWSPERYTELRDYLVGYYHGKGANVLTDLIAQEMSIAQESGQSNFDEADAMDEVVAKACEDMLSDPDAVADMMEHHTSLFAKIKIYMDSFLAAIRRAVGSMRSGSDAAKMLWADTENLRKAQEIWFDCLENASESLRGKVEAEIKKQVQEIRETGKKNADGEVLVPGTDFVLVDYTEPARLKHGQGFELVNYTGAENRRETVNRPVRETGIALREDTRIANIETARANATQEVKPSEPIVSGKGTNYDNVFNFHLDRMLKNGISLEDYTRFAEKWYDSGYNGEDETVTGFDENDRQFPDYLVNKFRMAGKRAAAKGKTRFPSRKKKGETNDVQAEVQVPDERPVHGAGALRSEDVRAVGTVPAEPVQEDGGGGDSVSVPEENGRRPAGADDGNGQAGSSRGRSLGDREGSDLRPERGPEPVNAEPAAEQTEAETQRQETEQAVEEQRRRMTETPKNFHMDKLDLPNGEKARFNANVDAIRTVRQLMEENRPATAEEQDILSKFVGWGGLKNAFEADAKGWSKEYKLLKSLLSEDEWNEARQSTMNAHYTEISVIRAMYEGLKNFGFHGGRILEPSAGVGNFIGAMPADIARTVSGIRMVELDPITGNIAKYLYPQARVDIKGFEATNIADNSVDVAIGNVPFGKTAPFDKKYSKAANNLHNYFFAKAIDKVRPGGILMFITSSYTMDSNDDTFRNYMMTKADMLGAIRLPNDAFKGNAATSVTTDIIVYQKRAAGTEYAGARYTSTRANYTENGYIRMNEYFVEHPEMVLGIPSMTGTMYKAEEMTVNSNGKPLAPQIVDAMKRINAKMTYDSMQRPEVAEHAAIEAGKHTKNNGLERRSDGIYRNVDGELVKVEMSTEDQARVTGLLDLKTAARSYLEAQRLGKDQSEIDRLRGELNELYDAFIDKYGYVNDPDNAKAMQDDPDYRFLQSLETGYKKASGSKSKKNFVAAHAEKSDLFRENTVKQTVHRDSAENVREAMNIALNESNTVDMARIAELTGTTQEQALNELVAARDVFIDADGLPVQRDEYLSGNVRQKLSEAEALAEDDDRYKANVEELRKVMPKDLTHEDIRVKMGATWIPAEIYTQYLHEFVGNRRWSKSAATGIYYNAGDGSYTIDAKKNDFDRYYRTDAMRKYTVEGDPDNGIRDIDFLDFFKAAMNNRDIKVTRYVKDADGIIQMANDGKQLRVIDKDKTASVRELQDQFEKDFIEWLWGDTARTKMLTGLYNEAFNSHVQRNYDGDALTIDGMSATKTLRKHQAGAVTRIVQQGGNVLLAHKVGAGKTAEMAGACMKLRQLGIVKKPVIIAPKNIVGQWGAEFLEFFPAAKLLVADESSFTKENRGRFVNMIATNDYDAIIMSYEQFSRISMNPDFQKRFYQEQIDALEKSLNAKSQTKRGRDAGAKDIAKAIAALKRKLSSLEGTKDDSTSYFDELGIDGLFVDEAHNFKNLMYTSNMQVSGLGNSKGSQRAFDLYMKTRYLQQLNGGRGIVFATATPVMNSMSEMYTMQRYLQPDVLKRLNIDNFDAWANMFGKVVNSIEMTPDGNNFRIMQSFSRFTNMPELQSLFRSFADVMTTIPNLEIPKLRGGKRILVECDLNDFQKQYVENLGKRSDMIKAGAPGKTSNGMTDNMLVITMDGRKCALSQKLVAPEMDFGEGSKLYRCVDRVFDEYRKSADIKGTQIVFCDLSTPANAANNSVKGNNNELPAEEETDTNVGADNSTVYDEIRRTLVEKGIPESEIAFIHEAKNQAQKNVLFERVRNGEVRVLIGSTAKMGVGMNVQDRMVALHHLDCPYRPGDIEQREGRALRQGNVNKEVAIYNYVTVGSFDAYLWGKIERKQGFIAQAMNGTNTQREIEGDELALSAAETKAITSGNPLLMEQVQVENELRRLESLENAYLDKIRDASAKAAAARSKLSKAKMDLEERKADAAKLKDVSGDRFSIVINGKTIEKRVDAGETLIRLAQKSRGTGSSVTEIGTFAGLTLIMDGNGYAGVRGEGTYGIKVNMDSATGTMRSLENAIAAIPKDTAVLPHEIELQQQNVDFYEEQAAQPFDHAKQIAQYRARAAEIEEALNPSNRDDTAGGEEAEGSNVQYSERNPDVRSDRELLLNAFEGLAANETERGALEKYRNKIEALNEMSDRLAELKAQIKDMSFATGSRDTAALNDLITKKNALAEKIGREDKALLRLEKGEILRNIIQVERAKDAVRIKEKADARVRQIRENAKANDVKASLAKRVFELSSYLTHPTNKKYVPETLRGPLLKFLQGIDFTSKQQLKGGKETKKDIAFAKNLQELRDALGRVNSQYSTDDAGTIVEDNFGMFIDLPDGFKEELTKLTAEVMEITDAAADGFTINKMSASQLMQLSKLISALHKSITNVNKLLSNNLFKHVDEATADTIMTLKSMRAREKSTRIGANLEWDNAMPAYAFERFGKGGQAIFEGFRNGQAAMAFNTDEILQFCKNAFSEKEAREWSNDVRTVQLTDTDTIRIPVAMIMSLHCLNKREQAKGHLYGGGIRVANYDMNGKTVQDTGHLLTEEMVAKLDAELNERQRWVADQMQAYMAAKGAQWGNYVSLRRFGYRFFEEGPNYFPISSDGNFLPTFSEEGKSGGEGRNLYSLLNISPAKDTIKGANNRIVLYNIFDVFSNHMSDMAQYNAYALPVLDAIKWLNYREKYKAPGTETQFTPTSVKSAIQEAYGNAAKNYVTQMIADVSGAEAAGGKENTAGLTMLHRYNRAQVAANLRVAALQPLAYIRAAMQMDAWPMMQALLKNPFRVKQNIAEMQELSGIAKWKDLGFYDNNVSRSVRQLIKGEDRPADKLVTRSMTLAEKMDQITWACMWEAAKTQTAKTIDRDSDAFFPAVTQLFEDTIYKTQVVDSILTKSSFMRNGSTWNKTMSSFMSESVTTYNMLADNIWKLADAARQKNGADAATKNRLLRTIGRTAAVYSANVIITTILEQLFNAWRDDDKYKTFGEKFRDGFWQGAVDNAAPWNMIPLYSQLWEGAKSIIGIFDDNWYGFDSSNPFTQSMDMLSGLVKVMKEKYDAIEKYGDSAWASGYTQYGIAYKGMQLVSAVTGLPFATGSREAVTLWNSVMRTVNPAMIVQTYNNTVGDAAAALMGAIRTNDTNRENRIRQTMFAGGYSQDAIDKAMKTALKSGYLSEDIPLEEAVRLLEKEAGMDTQSARQQVDQWETAAQTGSTSKYGKLYSAIDEWNGAEVKDTVKDLLALGYDTSSIQQGITNRYKDDYLSADKKTKAEMKQHLIAVYEWLGLTHDKAKAKVDKWDK